jgi:predicted RNA methylase
MKNYSLNKYLEDINSQGLEKTWDMILNYIKEVKQTDFLKVENFGELYELGLAEVDKHSKKKAGQYYTPEDVCNIMTEWLYKLDGENICDVGCGTGNLILSYLNLVGKERTEKLLKEQKLYLYDMDKVALKIAKYSIAILYGLEYLDNINVTCGDFLDDSITLPNNSKVISNPPYGKLTTKFRTDIQKDTKDLYSAFMEKILKSGSRAVIITPHSFLGGSKFLSLRKLMNNYNGFILSFDNVPDNIFKGKKHGIFNSNKTISVRASITVVENKPKVSGFKTSHLIRFKSEERSQVLKAEVLDSVVAPLYQVIDETNTKYVKCHKELVECFNTWREKSTMQVRDLVTNNGKYKLYIPNTCRYFTVASSKKLNRVGYIELTTDTLDKYIYLYVLINSSFAYWWWRNYDGGITYPKSLLLDIPVFSNLLTDDKKYFLYKANQMMAVENNYITITKNAGRLQENIKFPKTYRDEINGQFLKILKCQIDASTLDVIHSNHFLKEYRV